MKERDIKKGERKRSFFFLDTLHALAAWASLASSRQRSQASCAEQNQPTSSAHQIAFSLTPFACSGGLDKRRRLRLATLKTSTRPFQRPSAACSRRLSASRPKARHRRCSASGCEGCDCEWASHGVRTPSLGSGRCGGELTLKPTRHTERHGGNGHMAMDPWIYDIVLCRLWSSRPATASQFQARSKTKILSSCCILQGLLCLLVVSEDSHPQQFLVHTSRGAGRSAGFHAKPVALHGQQ